MPPIVRGELGRVRFVAFDAVGTLIYADPPVPCAYRGVAHRYGSRLSEAEIGERFAVAFHADEGSTTHATGEQQERQRWRAIVGNVLDDVDDPVACFEDLFEHFAEPASWRCYDDVAETLAVLEQNGYRLGMASNFDRRLERILAGLPELQTIAFSVISSVVGFRKPSGEFYGALIDAAGCRPNEILMVGDDEINDVRAAQAAGLWAIRLDRRGHGLRGGEITNLRQLLGMLGLSTGRNLR